MSTLSQLRERLHQGATITCVRNTFRPERDGAVATVVALAEPHQDRVICKSMDGSGLEIFLPTKRRDVVWLDEETARWTLSIGGKARPEPHTVTYRIEAV